MLVMDKVCHTNLRLHRLKFLGIDMSTLPPSSVMPKIINKAKIACLDFSLQKAKMHLGVSVVVNDPAKLADIRERWALYGDPSPR